MSTVTTNVHEAAEAIANEVFTRPTPEAIDELAKRYKDAKARVVAEQEEFETVEQEAIEMVTMFGIVPPNAEKSRRLNGKLAELTVTKGDTLTINDERVITLKEVLESVGRRDLFDRLFALRSKYEVVEGAESALRTEKLPKRMAEKILNMWGRCIGVKPKKASLKVVITDPATPKKAPKKGGTQ